MEKLQAAIEKARQKRAEEAASATMTPPPPEEATQPGLWSSVEELSLSVRGAKRNRIFIDGRAPEAIHYDRLRTKILQQCRDNGWRRVLLTSATKGCGKTTTCANLAASFTRQSDRKMILLDLDLRRPGLARQLGAHVDHNLFEVFDGSIGFAEQARRLGENVLLGLNDRPHSNPSKLMLQDRTPEVLSEIESAYSPDLILFDSAPMLSTDDTMAFLKHVDAALIIAAAEYSTTEEVDRCERELAEQTNVMGVVLNKCIYFDDGSRYGYSY